MPRLKSHFQMRLCSGTLRICADIPLCQFFNLAKRGPLCSDSNFSLWHEGGRKGGKKTDKERERKGKIRVRDF